MNKNTIALYKGLICVPENGERNLAIAMSVQHQLMIYGYMLNEEAFDMLCSAEVEVIKQYYTDVITYLKEITGGSREFKSFYGNFPLDVMSKSRCELFFDQINHYWGQMTFEDKSAPKEEAFEHVNYRMIKKCPENEFVNIYTTLAGSGQSLTPVDQKILGWFGKNYTELPAVNIAFKENLAIMVKHLPNLKVKTTVDVLRVATYFSGGDPALPAVPKMPKPSSRNYSTDLAERNKFRFKLTEEEKQRVMFLFENSNLDLRDMKQGRRYGRFIRLAEVINIGIRASKYPKTASAFNWLRNQKRKGKPKGKDVIRTWYSEVDKAFAIDFLTGITKLAERPGEFIRKMDYLVRNNLKELPKIMHTLAKIGERSSNKVLFEVYTHFENRLVPVTGRGIFIKGARKKTPLPDLPALSKAAIESIQETVLDTIRKKMEKLPPLGRCFIDEELKKIPMPTNMRSMSESMIPVVRGSRIPFGDKKVLRAFVHWFDEKGNEDIDLHGFLFNENKSVSFGYNGIYSDKVGNYSGDIRHRHGACAEYVDIDIKEAVKQGYNYYAMVVHNFQSRPLSTMKDCYAGYMTRDNAKSNSTWLPSTVENSVKPQSNSHYLLLAAFDLVTREYIYLDMDWHSVSSISGSSGNGLFKAIQPFIVDPKLSVYDLLKWHVNARGSNSSKETADIHFKFEDFSKDYTKIIPYLGV